MIIACNSITKSFNEEMILRDINFHIEDQEKVALVGNNGAGKTTLFRILTGQLASDNGEVFLAKDKKVGYLHQNFKFESSRTVYDELLHVFDDVISLEAKLHEIEAEIAITHSMELTHTYDNLRQIFEDKKGYSYKSLVKGVLKGLGFTPDVYEQSINNLSGGQKTRVALAKLLLEEPDLLLLDEPTNHLDISATEWLENFLRGYSGAVIVISHDRYFLDKIATKVIHIEFGKSYVYHGNYSYYLLESEKVYEAAMHQYEKQQQEIARQQAVIAKLRQFNREKSIKRARSREKLLAKQQPSEVPMIDNKPMNLILRPRITTGQDVLFANDLSMAFDDHLIFQNLFLDIKKGAKVAIVGPNGVGKTTLFKIIMGQLKQKGGTLHLGSNVCIGYYDQEHATLNETSTIIEELQNTFPTLTNGHIRNVLAAFLFTGEDVFKPISMLSGGEKGRVALAKIMLSEANLLLLDEPTNHLDIMSKEVLENALNQYEGTVIFVSHDRYFINQTATEVIEMQKDHATVFLGDYDYYTEKKKENTLLTQTLTPAVASTQANKLDWKKQKELQNKIKKMKTTLVDIENRIATEEDNLLLLDEALCQEEVYTNPERTKDIMSQKEALDTLIAQFYADWERISEELSTLED